MHGFVCLCEVLKVFKNDLKILEKSLNIEKFEKEFKFQKFEMLKRCRKNKTSQTLSLPPLLS
jgi:serine protease inhibitor